MTSFHNRIMKGKVTISCAVFRFLDTTREDKETLVPWSQQMNPAKFHGYRKMKHAQGRDH
jgi:hypothetical protein